MIDKVKTINKAQSKYRTIFPAHGKHTLEEGFFCLRGEFFFQFRTKDKKVHTVKALKLKPVVTSVRGNRHSLVSLFRLINKPILIRSLIIKNSTSTPLMLGFYTA